MRDQKRIVWIFLAVCFAVNGFTIGDGGQAGSFLRYGIGGRALGMGRAFVAVSDDASSVCLNPAGLMGVRRLEFTSMYSNLFYDSQFAQIGLVYPRPSESIQNPLLRFIAGPNASLGFNWVGLSMAGFEQTSATGELLGNFDVSENAFVFAWAREEVGNWGLFRYGMNVKNVNQNFPGLISSHDMFSRRDGRDWSFGMDLGLSFQPIHAPLFRAFSLRYLIPLRMAFSIQNVIQPGWKTNLAKEDIFPRVFRGGFSYRLVLKDWIPTSWNAIRKRVSNSQILTAVDWEWMRESKTGIYFGLEGIIPVGDKGFHAYPRFGLNNRTEGPSLGMGVDMPFARSAVVRVDYAYGFHPYLPNDSRFFLTLKLGKNRGIEFLRKQSEQTKNEEKEARLWLLKIVAEYPDGAVQSATEKLTSMEGDSVRLRRYYELIGGLGLADCLFQDAQVLLRQNKFENAKKKALDAVKEYTSIFNQRENNPLNDNQLMDYGEALILAGRPKDAVHVLAEVIRPAVRSNFLIGLGEKALGNWDPAMASFKNSVNNGAENARLKMAESELNPRSMVSLSYLHMAEILIQKNDFREALNWLNRLLEEFPDSLDLDYPRYPIFEDLNIVDDAQFLKGICLVQIRQYETGVTALLETERFYPFFRYGQNISEQSFKLIDILENPDWEKLFQWTEELLKEYIRVHQIRI